jgi:uncharacterized membrane protein YdjX (TVP38/TMEM64 family)
MKEWAYTPMMEPNVCENAEQRPLQHPSGKGSVTHLWGCSNESIHCDLYITEFRNMKMRVCCPNRAFVMATAIVLLGGLCSFHSVVAFQMVHPLGHDRVERSKSPIQTPYHRVVSRRHVSGTNVDFSSPTTLKRRDDTRVASLENGFTLKQPFIAEEFDMKQLALPSFALLLSLIVGVLGSMGYTIHDVVGTIQNFIYNPQTVLEDCIDSVQDRGAVGVLYFGMFYVLAEILAVPAVPLTLSAGYLFGIPTGVAVVLCSATIAASIAFLIGKTVLRSWVESAIVEGNPKVAKIDRAIGERGFKLLVLLRLSPIFPFALSNYVYGASSIDFPSYFWSTLLGFAPGTIAYVYTGMVGKELMLSGGAENSSQPWYVYAAGLTILTGLLKLASDVATGILESVEEDDSELGDAVP